MALLQEPAHLHIAIFVHTKYFVSVRGVVEVILEQTNKSLTSEWGSFFGLNVNRNHFRQIAFVSWNDQNLFLFSCVDF